MELLENHCDACIGQANQPRYRLGLYDGDNISEQAG